MKTDIKPLFSPLSDEKKALQQIAQDLLGSGQKYSLVVLFISSEYSPKKIESALKELFDEQKIIACSTAGEITPSGYMQHTISGFALSENHFNSEIICIEELEKQTVESVATFVNQSREKLQRRIMQSLQADNAFLFLIADGLSMAEEVLASGIKMGLPDISMLGGSAGDGLDFKQTWVYYYGNSSSNRAVMALIYSKKPFQLFKTEHFEYHQQSAHVVTEADAGKRIVYEIDALPAADAYAQMIGVEVDNLTTEVFALHPLAVRIDNNLYIRSIQKVVANGGLLFYCAIERGIILYPVSHHDMLDNLQHSLNELNKNIGRVDQIIACDCILRQFEARQNNALAEYGDLLAKNRIIGFSTYGEQFEGIHINQTFTAIAFAQDKKPDE